MQLVVLHVAAPPQKKNLVPATLRPEQLESGVKDRNIRLEQDIKFLSRDREPGGKAGDVVRAAAPPRTLRRSPSRHHASLPSSLQLMPEPAGAWRSRRVALLPMLSELQQYRSQNRRR
jgi:hypothetical protein